METKIINEKAKDVTEYLKKIAKENGISEKELVRIVFCMVI